jgi:hypothetical protein
VIARAFPDTPATFVRDVALTYLAESVDVDTQVSTSQEHAAAHGIAAVCAAQCWGTLAEIERITVRLAGLAYLTRMRCESPDVWHATVSGPASAGSPASLGRVASR